MKFGLEQHIIDKLISVFEQNSKVDKAYIFGSRAKGNYRPDSDIDIAIKGQDITTDDIISMSVDFESKGINYKIDLINYHTIKEPDLKEHINRVGIEFYSRRKKIKLGEVISINKRSIDKDYPFEDIEYLDTGSITQNKIEGFQYFKLKEAPSRAKRLVQKDDIIYSTVRPIQRHYGFIRDFNKQLVVSTGFAVITTNKDKADAKYIYYLLSSDDVVNFLDSIADGSTSAYPSLRPDDIALLDIELPPIIEQTNIAHILSSIDDKIELLQNQNKTLEQLAEALFRQWFIEGATFTETLGDYVDTANTGLDAIKRAPIVEYETGIKCLRIQDVSQHKPIKKWGHSKVEEINFKKFQLKRDDIIMARTCSPGINYFVREDLPAVFNNGLVRIRAKKERVNPILLYYLFKTRDFIGHIDAISGGTSVQLNMQVGQLLSYEFSFPSIEKQNEIIESFIAFDNKIFENNNQIANLIELRDTLLPKLVNGEIRISELKAVAN